MRVTKSTLLTAQKGSAFFLSYPDAVAELEEAIKSKGIPTLFHEAGKTFEKEIAEHKSSENLIKSTKSNLRELSSRLRHLAYDLEDVVNVLLKLNGQEEHEIDFVRTKNDIYDYERLVTQLEHHTKLIEANVTLKTSFDNFKKDLTQYKSERAKIGDALSQEEKEELDVDEATLHYRPIISALSSAVYQYLRHTSPNLFEAWRTKKPKKASANSGDEVEENA